MNIRKIAAVTLLVISSFAATNVAPSKSELEGMYDKAFRAFDSNNFAQALKELDAIDARQPDLAESQNLRGVILMRQGSYDKAEEALQKALQADPKFWNARFNLAEIPFLRKNWAEARNRFEALMAGNSSDLQREATQLIQYKILLTYLLEGKENMIESIVSKFEVATDTPAINYANAAVALHHRKAKEAKEWISSAEKNFSPSLNKLFAESFYEVGWMEKPAAQTRAALELTSAADRAVKFKTEARAKFDLAERAFQKRDFGGALKLLDEAEAIDPNQAAYFNLRGEILMEQKEFDLAEAAFRKTFKVDPKFREAQYNLAQIPFKKKEYAKSRDRLEALFGETPGGEKDQASQLIKFKIFLTYLLEGNDSRAQKMMERFQFTGDTPALYYAQAAWEFKHNSPDKAKDWIASARKIYSPAMNIVFADSFYDTGWLDAAPVTGPATPEQVSVASAQVETSPGPVVEAKRDSEVAQSAPAPVLAMAETKPLQDVVIAEKIVPLESQPPAASPAAVIASAVKTESSPAKGPLLATSAPAPAPVVQSAPALSAAAPVELQSTGAAPVVAAVAANSPAASPAKAPVIASAAASPAKAPVIASAAASPAKLPATSVPAAPMPQSSAPTTVATVATASPAATALAPARIREWSQPTFAETLDRWSNPNTLLVGVLLFAGVGLLGWLLAKQFRGTPAHADASGPIPIYRPARPLTEPSFLEEPASDLAVSVPVTRLAGGPPRLSVQLKASEPAVRRASMPAGIPLRSSDAPSDLPESHSDEGVGPVMVVPSRADDVPLAPAEKATENVGEDPETIPVAADPSVEEQLRDVANVSLATESKNEPESAPVTIEQPSEPALPVEGFVATPLLVAASLNLPDAAPSVPEIVSQSAQPVLDEVEPVGQGQPIPFLTSAPANETFMPEITTPASSNPPQNNPSGTPAPAGIGALRSAVDAPSFAPQVVATPSANNPPTAAAPMSEPTPSITPSQPAAAPLQSGGFGEQAAGQQPASASQTAVQITFSFEIGSLQLTPSFKMGALQLKPISRIVAMRLAPSQNPQPAMNLQVTFEIASIQLAGNSIGTIRLTPSSQQKPTVHGAPSFQISALQLVSSFESAPVQLTPSQQGGHASVHLTAAFQIASVEFSQNFEIAAVVLTAASKKVAVQLPGSGVTAIESAPVFEINNVQLSNDNQLSLVQLSPSGAAAVKRA